jgi:hypothetical protein
MKALLNVRGAMTAALFALAWSHAGNAQALQFYNLTPCRAVDTRYGYGGIVNSGPPRTFQMKGVCGVPSDAVTVTLNVTMIGPTQSGFLTLWPAGAPMPIVSNVNASANEPAIANGAVVPLAASIPDLSLVYGIASGSATTNVALDVTGYFK